LSISGDGVINFPEFLNMMAKNFTDGGMASEGPLEHMFKIFDRDNDGFITRAEMKRALGM
jgi:Ca2+-binding EF-hand superfamily protein